jgi:small subunit ribosomal protein S20
LANSAQARKRARQAETRRRQNASARSVIRTYIKKVNAAIEDKNYDEATAAYVIAVPIIDSMADKSIIHANKAARHKSRLNSAIKALKA